MLKKHVKNNILKAIENISIIGFVSASICMLMVVLVLVSISKAIFGISYSVAVLVGVTLSGWLFYPLYRFFLPKKLGMSHGDATEDLTRALTIIRNNVNLADNNSVDKQWTKILEATFRPQTTEHLNHSDLQNTKNDNEKRYKQKKINSIANDNVLQIENAGQSMIVPIMTNSTKAYRLYHADNGQRRFDNADIRQVQYLRELFSGTHDMISAHKALIKKEREQLAKDLHDDLSAKLLSMLRTSTETQKPVVLEALSDLRNVLNQLDAHEMNLLEVFATIRLEMKSRISFYNTEFIWDMNIAPEKDIKVTSRTYNNLRRIFREATTNALKYMDNDHIKTVIQTNSKGFLSISITNVGTSIDNQVGTGKGLSNIVSRANQINGHVNWQKYEDAFVIKLLVNLNKINQPLSEK